MHLMKGALGVDCTYCHIEREWDKDVKAKPIARQMITMMMTSTPASSAAVRS